jgi:transmembrane sensor
MARESEDVVSIPDQAAHWWVTFREGEATSAEKSEFVDWVKRSPESVEASLRIARVHAALSRPDVRWPQTSAEELIRAAKAVPEDNVVPLHRRAAAPVAAPPRRTATLKLGLAASLLVAVCVGWFSLTGGDQYQTKIGEQRSVLLADGSRVTLNTNSKIEVRLQANHRVVNLVRGEALFEVAHDAERPFDVRMGDVAVRAVGTQFDIDRRATRTTITVVEGRVAMIATGPRAQDVPILTAGDRFVVDASGAGTLQHGINLGVTTAWTKRQLIFQRRPLREIAEEFNRYNTGHVEIRSARLQDEEVTAMFRADDVASFVAVLAGIPGVQVTADGAGGYVVTSDESAASRE